MSQACEDVLSSYRDMGMDEGKASVTLVTPPDFRRPPGFPRGYLLQRKDDGTSIWHFNATRLQAWLRRTGLVKT